MCALARAHPLIPPAPVRNNFLLQLFAIHTRAAIRHKRQVYDRVFPLTATRVAIVTARAGAFAMHFDAASMVRGALRSRQYINPAESSHAPPKRLLSTRETPPKETFRTFGGSQFGPLAPVWRQLRTVQGPHAPRLRPESGKRQMGGPFFKQNIPTIQKNTI